MFNKTSWDYENTTSDHFGKCEIKLWNIISFKSAISTFFFNHLSYEQKSISHEKLTIRSVSFNR